MVLEFVNEFEIDKVTSGKINVLLKKCFTGFEFNNLDYFKQLPHYRILVKESEELIGQLGIDFRVMNLNGEPVNVFGIIDFCVDPQFQKQGVGKSLLQKYESIALKHPDKIDFLFLVSDIPQYYEQLGYMKTDIATKWLKINQHRNIGIGNEKIDDASFLVKSISGKEWKDGELDMLGYMY